VVSWDLFLIDIFSIFVCVILVLDILFLLSLRLGYESTRLYMNDSIRAFFACFQSTYEPAEDANRLRTTSTLGSVNKKRKHFFMIGHLITGSSLNRVNSQASTHGHNTNVNSMDGDEYCRITIDSLTNSYKIGSPVIPRGISGRQTRSISHSLLTAQYMEGK
jgi:hypothetical protein